MKGCGCFTVGTGRAGHIKRITAWIQQRWLWKAPERLTGLVMWTGMSFILDTGVETAKNANSSLVNEVANSYMYTGRMSLTSTQKISITAQYAKLRLKECLKNTFRVFMRVCVFVRALWMGSLARWLEIYRALMSHRALKATQFLKHFHWGACRPPSCWKTKSSYTRRNM